MFSFIAALAVFCIVQDRVTAAGAKQYGELSLAAIAKHQAVTPVDAVMRPAIRRSVRLGLLSAGAVLIGGLGTAALLRPSSPRREHGAASASRPRSERG